MTESNKYTVELESGVWLAPWAGDPGRTLLKDNADIFLNKKLAEQALKRARKLTCRNGFPNAAINPINYPA